MPKALRIYNDFSAGINTKSNPKNIEQNELVAAQGVLCDEKGAIRTTSPPAKITGLTDKAATITPGRGIFSFKSDYSYSDTANTLAARESEYICIADVANSEIDIYGHNDADDTNDHALQESVINLGSGSALEAEYYYADGALRVADASFSSNNTVKWFGPIMGQGSSNKKRLLGMEIDTEWVSLDNNLAAPTLGLSAPSLSGTADASTSTNTTLGDPAAAPLTSSITAYASASTGVTRCTSSSHGLSNGEFVIITGTTSYNGRWLVQDKTTNTFDIPTQYIANDATGNWLREAIVDNFQGWSTDVSSANSDSRWVLAYDVTANHVLKISAINETTQVFTTDTNSTAVWDNRSYEIFPFPGDGILLEAVSSVGNNKGTWPKGDYEFAQSFIYEGSQESKLTIMNSDPLTMEGSEIMYVRAHVSGVSNDAENNAQISQRLIGGRVYTRIKGSNDFWSLLLDMDFRVNSSGTGGGTRIYTVDTYDAWETVRDASGGSTIAGITNSNFEGFKGKQYSLNHPSVESYENLNGFSSGEHAISFGEAAGYGYKTSVVAGSRVFVGNVNYKSSEGIVKVMGDTILYTPHNKYDTFPSSYKLDIGGNDGDEFTALAYSSGILFAFKKQSLFMVDVSSPSDAAWKLLNRYEGLGVQGPWAVTNTSNGIAWASKSGVYSFQGKNFINLTENKLSFNDWSTFYGTGDGPVVGFDPSSNKLVIPNKSLQLNRVRIIDLITGSITDGYHADGYNLFWGIPAGSATSISNMITFIGTELEEIGNSNRVNANGGIIVYGDENYGSGNNCDLYSLSLSSTGTSKFIFVTKNDDFGTPHIKKKLYEFNIEYILGTDTTEYIDIRYSIDGNDAVDDDSTAMGQNMTLTRSASFDNSNILNIKLTDPIEFRTISFRISNYNENSGTALKIKFLGISVLYRAITKKYITTETASSP